MAVRKRKTRRVKKARWQQVLVRHGACDEAVKFANRYATFEAAWKACRRGDWMVWWVKFSTCGLLSLSREAEHFYDLLRDHMIYLGAGETPSVSRRRLLSKLATEIRQQYPKPPMPVGEE